MTERAEDDPEKCQHGFVTITGEECRAECVCGHLCGEHTSNGTGVCFKSTCKCMRFVERKKD